MGADELDTINVRGSSDNVRAEIAVGNFGITIQIRLIVSG